MKNIQSLTFWKKPSFILALVLTVFFLKGVFLTVLHPIFIGQDEARHYNTLQYLAEPKEKNWEIIERKKEMNKEDVGNYNFSQEIRETGKISGLNIIRGEVFNTPLYSDGYIGIGEEKITAKGWNRHNEYYPSDIVGGRGFYHTMASWIEKNLADQNILVRFFLIRIFSVILGVLTILLAYWIAKNIRFSSKISLILTAIISFQPRLTIYFTNINYDALLILSFTLFMLGGVMGLRKGICPKSVFLIILSVLLGVSTKGTGLIILFLAVLLLSFLIYKKTQRKFIFFLSFFMMLIALLLSPYNPLKYLPFGNGNSFFETIKSLGNYLFESLTLGRLSFSSKIYWGYVGWINSWFLENFIYLIWFLEFFAFIGLIWFLFSKKKVDFLPEKKFIIFLLLMLIALQIGIRSYDWKIFDRTNSFALGTPGRYFLPTLIAHIIIIFTGMGMLFKKAERFENSLKIGLILMFAFSMFIIFNIIMPRFYL